LRKIFQGLRWLEALGLWFVVENIIKNVDSKTALEFVKACKDKTPNIRLATTNSGDSDKVDMTKDSTEAALDHIDDTKAPLSMLKNIDDSKAPLSTLEKIDDTKTPTVINDTEACLEAPVAHIAPFQSTMETNMCPA
jgi:hypothetical protein